MATVTLKGNSIRTNGDLPKVGAPAPDWKLVKSDLSEVALKDYSGKMKVLNIFPSIDTPVCASSVRKFNQEAAKVDQAVVLCISRDLPFALKRFCGAENIQKVETLSAFRSTFAQDYGIELTESGLKGLCARAIVVLDKNNKVLYTELVPEIGQEPNYAKALSALG